MKNIFILSAILLVANIVKTNAQITEENISLKDEIAVFTENFNSSNYDDILTYNDIITRCNTIPKSEEELFDRNASNDQIINAYMLEQFIECKDVKRVPEKDLREFYFKLVSQEIPEAKFLYAALLPYNSIQKTEFLIESLVIGEKPKNLLTEIALFEPVGLTDQQRYFLIVMSDAELIYPEQYTTVLLEIESRLSNEQFEQLNILKVDIESGQRLSFSEAVKILG